MLRTLGAPGDLAPLLVPAPWSFHLGLTARPTAPRVQLRADGFCIRFAWEHRECVAVGVFMEPGVLLGYTDAPITPSLFSAEYEIHHGADLQWLEAGGTQAVLIRNTQGHTTKFCLAAGAWDRTEAVNLARRCLDASAEHAFEEGDALRQRIAVRLTDTPGGYEELAAHAVESLLARVQRPQGVFAHRWCSTANAGAHSLDANLVLAVTTAWSRLDPQVAEGTLQTLFSFQRDDGAIPAMIQADGSADFTRAPIPLVAFSASLLADHPNFQRSAIPHLRRYLQWALDYFDPMQTGRPAWRSAREAWISSTFDARLRSADLAAMLLCEINAYESIARAHPSAANSFGAAKARLVRALQGTFWNSKAGAFLDAFEDGSHVERVTLGTVPALLCRELDESQTDSVLKLLEHTDALYTPRGAAMWTRWEGDAQAPPVRATDQIAVLAALHFLKAGAAIERRLKMALWKTLGARYLASHRLYADLQEPLAEEKDKPVACGLSDFEAAALAVVLAAPYAEPEEDEEKTGVSAWLIRHAKVAVAAGVSVPVAAAIIIILGFLARKTPTFSYVEASMGMAQQYYKVGEYQKAIALYEDLSRKGRYYAVQFELPLANAYFRQGDLTRAEMLYRAALNRPEPSPMALLNLGLALFKQGRVEEAAACYSRYLDQFGERWPEQAERAKTAIELIRERRDGEARFANGS